MKEGAPQDNKEKEKYTVEHHLTDKDGITEDRFINKETGLVEKFILVLPDGQRVEVILNPKTGEVKQVFRYDENGSTAEFIDQKAIDNINREWAVIIKKAKEQKRNDILTKLMFENFALGDEIRKQFGQEIGRQFRKEEKERGN